jgi:two-component system sensor histidine kinase LytS
VIYQIEKDVACLLPPLTLQPIVENAIKHGLLPQKQGGVVRIMGMMYGKEAIIHIEDNGVGIEENKLHQILDNDMVHKDSLGVNNVNQRLKGIFGEKYGLQIDSKVGEGTSVTIRIPPIENLMEGDESA